MSDHILVSWCDNLAPPMPTSTTAVGRLETGQSTRESVSDLDCMTNLDQLPFVRNVIMLASIDIKTVYCELPATSKARRQEQNIKIDTI